MEGSVTPAEKPTAPQLASLKQMFEESSSLTATARRESQVDRDYFDGNQWTREEKNALSLRKQPDNAFNRIRPAIEGVIGLIEQGQTDPKAWPRNPNDEDAAEVATKVLRYIEDKADFDQTKTEAALQYFIEGTCAAIVEMDAENEIEVNEVTFQEFFYDPRSRRKDFADARYMGIAKWRWADDVKGEYPDAKDAIETELSGAQMGDDSFADRPQDTNTQVAWTDGKKRRLMVVELYHKDKEWRRCVFYSGGVLAYDVSPYKDSDNKPKCPIVAASCYVDKDNNRYGKVRDMRGPQDEINKRRSKLLHLLSVSQVQARDLSIAMATSADIVRQEAAKPDGVLPPGWEKVPTTDMASGQAQLLAEAKAEIERMGPNPAILGRQGESSSGRAQLVRQQAGMTELAPTLGVFDRWQLRIYRAMWEAAKQFKRGPWWVRITDDDGAPEFVGINTPAFDPIPHPETGEPLLDPTSQKPVQMPRLDPRTGQQAIDNPIAQMDVDITIETTPDTANVAQEQFLALVDLAKAGVQIPPQILIEASSLPKKREIVEKMEKLAQQPDPARDLQMQGEQAKVENTQADTALKTAKAETEMVKPHIDLFKTGMQANQPPPPAAGDSGATG